VEAGKEEGDLVGEELRICLEEQPHDSRSPRSAGEVERSVFHLQRRDREEEFNREVTVRRRTVSLALR
jgi:hypothetical protein